MAQSEGRLGGDWKNHFVIRGTHYQIAHWYGGKTRGYAEANAHISALSSQVIQLQNVLSNKQARGSFGEVQLENLV